MPLDMFPYVLPAYEQAYVTERYDDLRPGAVEEYRQYFLTRTVPRWQVQMTAYVDVTGAVDASLPAYEKSYVRESYLNMRAAAELAYTEYFLDRTPWYWQAEMRAVAYVKSPFALFNYREAVINDGGTVSAGRAAQLQAFVEAEKAAGTYQLVDDYWLFAAENATQALISLKRGVRCTAVAAPAFAAGLGYTFNGTTQYLDTGFNPSLHAGALTFDKIRAAIWERTDATGNTTSFGCQDTSSRTFKVQPRQTGTMVGNANSQGATFTLPVATSVGYSVISRNGLLVTDVVAYKNGVALARTVDPTNLGASLPTFSVLIGANSNNGVPNQFRATQVAFACTGAALTPAQELAHYNNVFNLLALSGAAIDADAQLWANQVVTNGGAAVGAVQLSRIGALVAQLKFAGTWALLDDAWPLVAETSHQALTSLKQRRLATVIGAPVFAAGLGYTFDGVATGMDTGFIPATHAVAMNANSNRVGIYGRADLSNSGYEAGANSSASRAFRIRSRSGSNTALYANDGGSTYLLAVADARGFTVAARTGLLATNCAGYKNGVPLARTVDAPSVGASLPIVSIYLGGYNSGGVLTTPRVCTMGFLVAGAALSDAQEPAEYNAIQAYMTAWGAQV